MNSDWRNIMVTIAWRLFYGLCTTGFGVLATLLYGTVNQKSAVIIGLLYVPFLIVLLLVYQYREFRHQEQLRSVEIKLDEAQKEKEALEIQKQRRTHGLERSALDHICKAMRDCLWKTDAKNNRLEELMNGASPAIIKDDLITFLKSEINDEEKVTYALAQSALERMCDMFSRDTYAADQTESGSSDFKATIFEPIEEAQKIKFVRGAYSYPAGISPRTAEVKMEEHPRSALSLSYSREEMIVIQDIKKERDKSPDEARWDNFYAGQHQDYESMITTYFSKGAPKSASRKVLGIITIDTNRKEYFREEREWQQVWSKLLLPFRLYLASLTEMRRTQQILLSVLEKIESNAAAAT